MTARGNDFHGGAIVSPTLDVSCGSQLEVDGLGCRKLPTACGIRGVRAVNQYMDRWLGGCPRTGCVSGIPTPAEDVGDKCTANGNADRGGGGLTGSHRADFLLPNPGWSGHAWLSAGKSRELRGL